tara:strand:- start:108 stop:404 length:297 start_codon:yes stop_codon:yes gene_type:complete
MTTIKRRNLGVTYYNEEKSARGFTLYAPQTGNGRVVLINMHGDVEHEWNLPVRPGRDAVILPNGNLGYNGSNKIQQICILHGIYGMVVISWRLHQVVI